MEKLKIEVEVAKEVYELGVGISQVVKAVKEALDNGWQMGEDLPLVLSAVISHLVPAVQGIDKISDELKEDPSAFAKGVVIPVSDAVASFLKKS